MTKRDYVHQYIQRHAREALLLESAIMSDRSMAATLRSLAVSLSHVIASHIFDEYRFLELMDICEWKRQRVRR